MLNRPEKSKTRLATEWFGYHTIAAVGQYFINTQLVNPSNAVTSVYDYPNCHGYKAGLSQFQGLQEANLARAAYIGATTPKSEWATWSDFAVREGFDLVAAAAAAAIYWGANSLAARDLSEVTEYEKAAVQSYGPGLVRAGLVGVLGLFKKKPTLDADMTADLLSAQEKGQAEQMSYNSSM